MSVGNQATVESKTIRLKRPRRSISLWPRIRFLPVLLVIIAMGVAALILLVPVYLLLRMAGSGSEAIDLLTRAQTLEILGNTLFLAGAVTLAAILMAVPIAWLTAQSDLPGRRMWTILAALPLVSLRD